MSSAAAAEEPYVVEDCRGVLKLLSDGSVIRTHGSFFSNLQSHDANYPSITWHDVTFDPVHNLQLRIYRPVSPPGPTRFTLLYIHGGGFVLGSRSMAPSHNLCLRLAAELGSVVVSVDYRLAPETRLPGAVEDVWTALKWVRTGWCVDDDVGEVFIFGDSAGGNIAHNVAVRVASGGSSELDPVRVKGYMLLGPMFGGSERTQSELQGPSETFLSLEALDRYWRLALPIGETTDHPLVNPFGPISPNLEPLNLGPMLVMVGERDLLRDRIKDYASRLSNSGKKVEYVEFEGLEHGFLATSPDPEPADQLLSLVKRFISENSG